MFNFFKKNTNKILTMDSISIDDKERFINEYFKVKKPVLIKNGAQDWDMLQKWTKDYIVDNAGDYICTIVEDSRPASSKQQTTLKNYFNRFTDKSTLTLDKYNPSKKPVFFRDIPLPNALFTSKSINRFFFYHSVKDAGTLLHNHSDAFNVLKEGKKHWIMHDADKATSPNGYKTMMEYFNLYPIGSHAKDWFKKELKKMPNKVDKVYECFQKAGDIVYVPDKYAHTVLNLEEVMGLVVETSR